MKKQTLYFNGEILTMADPLYTEAVLVEDGVIIAMGKRDDVLRKVTPETIIFNLNGAVLLPGFIDSHSHIAAFSQTLGVAQLSGCKSFADIQQKLKDFIQGRKIGGRDWVVGFGYDHNRLAEGAHPDKTLLDAALPGYRVLITHASGQMGIMSTIGLAAVGINESTRDPAGGKIGRVPGGMAPDGYLEGEALFDASAEMEPPDEDQLLDNLDLAQQVYARNGVTTAQEGLTKDDEWAMLRAFSDSGRLALDVICYVDPKEAKHLAQENLSRVQRYKRHLKIGGYKLFFDGSPQGRTAWMTTPYLGGEPGYMGDPIYSDEEAELLMFESMNDHLQLLVHCNGDAAAEQMISICQRITEDTDVGLRPVMVHAQLLRPDQLPRMARLGMIASFFTAHTYYWGDTHIRNFGPERASKISPAQSAKQAGVMFTFHQDTPTLTPNMLNTIWCAVNRTTRRGVALGPEEQVSTLDALKAVTINAAYQYFEEDSKGSIEVGKRADFVVLDFNPLRVRPVDIKRIRVLKTIKDDRVIYERES